MDKISNEKKQKKWFLVTLLGTLGGLLMILIAMVIVDPYFHYHGMVPGISYRLYSERYINRGIARHFEYDAVITGSSMNQNFKTSLMDELFGTNSIKIPFSGGGFREMTDTLRAAFESDNEIKYVLWGLDYNGLGREHYWKGYEEYPEYLYDDNLLNDVQYIWNKSILFEGLIINLLQTVQGVETTSFDDYSSWTGATGWEGISATYQRSLEILPMKEIEENTLNQTVENMMLNIVNLAKENPNTQFLLFYAPYSALHWEALYRDGELEKQLWIEAAATKTLLECDNIQLYSFADVTEVTGNINLYRDTEHYIAEINDEIMRWIAEGKGRVTRENYQELIQWEYDYYMNYDYDSLYK